MSDDWLTQLQQLHDDDKAKRQPEPDKAELAKEERRLAAALLRRSKAHELLRQMQKTLLGGGGTLDIFEQASDYERVISLVWQGPLSAARRPDPDDPEPYSYITVGVRDQAVWVNGKRVAKATPATLKAALLQAAKKPGRETKKSKA